MLTDTRIIQRRDGYEVLAECQAIPFHDGDSIQLHYVRRQGLDEVYLRAWEYDKHHWCVFDLRVVDRSFATELPFTLARDRPGVVLFTLRGRFSSAVAFEAHCFRNLAATWMALEREQLLRVPPAPNTPAITFQPELRSRAA